MEKERETQRWRGAWRCKTGRTLAQHTRSLGFNPQHHILGRQEEDQESKVVFNYTVHWRAARLMRSPVSEGKEIQKYRGHLTRLPGRLQHFLPVLLDLKSVSLNQQAVLRQRGISEEQAFNLRQTVLVLNMRHVGVNTQTKYVLKTSCFAGFHRREISNKEAYCTVQASSHDSLGPGPPDCKGLGVVLGSAVLSPSDSSHSLIFFRFPDTDKIRPPPSRSTVWTCRVCGPPLASQASDLLPFS